MCNKQASMYMISAWLAVDVVSVLRNTIRIPYAYALGPYKYC